MEHSEEAAVEVVVPTPPEDAPREQLFEFGVIAALQGGDLLLSMSTVRLQRRLAQAYLDRWHGGGATTGPGPAQADSTKRQYPLGSRAGP